MSRARTPAWLIFISARWKAIAAFIVSLAGALIVVFPGSHTIQVIIAIGTAFGTMTAVHQIPNVKLAAVGNVVEDTGTVVADTGGVVGDVTRALGGIVDPGGKS